MLHTAILIVTFTDALPSGNMGKPRKRAGFYRDFLSQT
jgi:hypothetical protein